MENKIKSAWIERIFYNQIHVKDMETKKIKCLYIEGLQKRILSNYDEETRKRFKCLEYIETDNEWETGVNFFVCCDVCSNALFSVNDEFDDSELNRFYCNHCDNWLCYNCVKNGLCKSCVPKLAMNTL